MVTNRIVARAAAQVAAIVAMSLAVFAVSAPAWGATPANAGDDSIIIEVDGADIELLPAVSQELEPVAPDSASDSAAVVPSADEPAAHQKPAAQESTAPAAAHAAASTAPVVVSADDAVAALESAVETVSQLWPL